MNYWLRKFQVAAEEIKPLLQRIEGGGQVQSGRRLDVFRVLWRMGLVRLLRQMEPELTTEALADLEEPPLYLGSWNLFFEGIDSWQWFTSKALRRMHDVTHFARLCWAYEELGWQHAENPEKDLDESPEEVRSRRERHWGELASTFSEDLNFSHLQQIWLHERSDELMRRLWDKWTAYQPVVLSTRGRYLAEEWVRLVGNFDASPDQHSLGNASLIWAEILLSR